jgi:prepilin-type N-terminal cleavage/methylation domain-containing protein
MFVYNFFRKKVGGFSLLEVSLVLAIMGIMAGLALPSLIQQKNIAKRRETLKRMEYVLSALGTYAAQHGNLPFPSQTPEEGRPIPTTLHDDHEPMGYLPYRVLGISQQMAEDAFGHPFHYVVERVYTTEIFKKNPEKDKEQSAIQLKGTDEQELIDPQEKVGVIILAENEAYNKAQGPWETTNIRSDSLLFYDGPYSNNPQQPFRHSVRWVPYKLLVNHYGHGDVVRPTKRPEDRPGDQHPAPSPAQQTEAAPPQQPTEAPAGEPGDEDPDYDLGV